MSVPVFSSGHTVQIEYSWTFLCMGDTVRDATEIAVGGGRRRRHRNSYLLPLLLNLSCESMHSVRWILSATKVVLQVLMAQHRERTLYRDAASFVLIRRKWPSVLLVARNMNRFILGAPFINVQALGLQTTLDSNHDIICIIISLSRAPLWSRERGIIHGIENACHHPLTWSHLLSATASR